ncbi:thioredoxin fold domain-containing protein (plasmid) [Pseudomonas silesiensis]|uniref:thioredoxin fold domain-containing protein n=1 Tax=Pseudomonas silesiensis TaxID=1853130 RepID=UPI0030D2AB82
MKIKKTSLSLNGSAFIALLVLSSPFAKAEGGGLGEAAKSIGGFFSEMTSPPVPKPAKQLLFIREAMDKLSADEYISYSPVNPQAHVYMLADPLCAYTREMHKKVPEFNAKGIEVRYVAAPSGDARDPAWATYRNIWCSGNQKQAFDDVVNGKAVKTSSCSENEVQTFAAQTQFIKDVTPTMTPTTYFQDGFWVIGADAAVVKGLPERAFWGAKIMSQYGSR